MDLRKGDLLPGQRISLDHYVNAVPEHLYSSIGSYQEKHMFHCGMIFSNHAIGYVLTRHQVNLSAGESLKPKLKYGRDATNCGVIVQSYHTHNGVFTSNQFVEVVIGQVYNIRFGGVGAAHQNGVPECSIKTVTYMDRTIMIHTTMSGPEGFITTQICHMAMD